MPRLPAVDQAVPGVCTRRGPSRRVASDWKFTSVNGKATLRPGVTLLELLVVLVLMAISAVLVLPALTAKSAYSELPDDAEASTGQRPYVAADPAVDLVLTTTRRLAVRQGEPLRVRVAPDGVWAILPLKGGLPVGDGRASLPLTWLPDVVVDALGTCVLAPSVSAPTGATAWDALACRWRGAP